MSKASRDKDRGDARLGVQLGVSEAYAIRIQALRIAASMMKDRWSLDDWEVIDGDEDAALDGEVLHGRLLSLVGVAQRIENMILHGFPLPVKKTLVKVREVRTAIIPDLSFYASLQSDPHDGTYEGTYGGVHDGDGDREEYSR